jgi:hypothetical protein
MLVPAYAAGRLLFGVGAMLAPRAVGELLVGPAAREPVPRTLMGNFGTRDAILGAGLLHALASDGPRRPWLAAGLAADVLDTVVQLREWKELPADKRLPGVVFAAGAAVVGAALLARED